MGKIAEVQEVPVAELVPYERNAKIHSAEQIEKIKKSIQEFGFLSPCLIDRQKNIIAGHGRVMAAKELGMQTVPCVYIEGLTDTQRKAYILAAGRLDQLEKSELKELVHALRHDGSTTTIYCDKPQQNKLHPTMKPVRLVARFIYNSSEEGDIIADIFGGSGTTLIAAEQLKRRCLMMELDPHYCDVIIDRWEQFTGRKAVKVNG